MKVNNIIDLAYVMCFLLSVVLYQSQGTRWSDDLGDQFG